MACAISSTPNITASAARCCSLALVPEDGGEEFYVTLDCDEPIDPVGRAQRHALPRHGAGRPGVAAAQPRATPRDALSHYLAARSRSRRSSPTGPRTSPNSAMLLMTGPGDDGPGPAADASGCVPLHGFSTAANSTVPHNALHDARALRDHVLEHLE